MVKLRAIAKDAGIETFAVCGAERFDDVAVILAKAKEEEALPPFTTDDIELRVDPQKTLQGAASFVVVISPYEAVVYQPSSGNFGNIAPSACGEDYHRIVMRQLKEVCEGLEMHFPDHHFLPFVDTSPFSEKHLAVRAGLGQILHNGLFYSYAYGSRCFIGLILTDLARDAFDIYTDEEKTHEEDKTVDNVIHGIDPVYCTRCRKCERMCPGGAISSEGFDSYRCVSWLTQKKEELTAEEKKMIGHQVYGCDVCQRVCPQNPMIPEGYETGEEVALADILGMTGSSFKKTYKATAAGWRGKNLLIRNAGIALENLNGQGENDPWPHGTHEA